MEKPLPGRSPDAMWQQLRSAVDDVKEFGSGAISEVSQGVNQVWASPHPCPTATSRRWGSGGLLIEPDPHWCFWVTGVLTPCDSHAAGSEARGADGHQRTTPSRRRGVLRRRVEPHTPLPARAAAAPVRQTGVARRCPSVGSPVTLQHRCSAACTAAATRRICCVSVALSGNHCVYRPGSSLTCAMWQAAAVGPHQPQRRLGFGRRPWRGSRGG